MFLANILLLLVYIFPFVGLFVAYYFAIYLPAKEEKNERIYLQRTLKIGDKVVTKGGLVGTVFQISKRLILLSLFDQTLVEVELESIFQKL